MGGGMPFTECMPRTIQMKKQNCEACTVAANMATLQGGGHKPGKIWGKDWIGYGHRPPEHPGKRLHREEPTHKPRKKMG